MARRLRIAVARLNRSLRQLPGQELPAPQIAALASLDRLGEATLGELAAVEQVRPPSMTPIVASLVEGGLVKRRLDPADRRVTRVRLTPAGARFLARARSRKTEELSRRLAVLDGEEIGVLERALDVLEAIVAQGRGDPARRVTGPP